MHFDCQYCFSFFRKNKMLPVTLLYHLKRYVILISSTVKNNIDILSQCFDILSFIDDYKVDLVITGHSYENGFLQFKSETGDLTMLIGLGTANAKNIGDNVKQSFAILDFNETNRIRLHIFKTNDSTKSKSFERCLPHTSEIRLRNE